MFRLSFRRCLVPNRRTHSLLCDCAPSSQRRRKPTVYSCRWHRSPCLSFNLLPSWSSACFAAERTWHCVSCTNVWRCQRLSTLQWPPSKRSAPFRFLLVADGLHVRVQLPCSHKGFLEEAWNMFRAVNMTHTVCNLTCASHVNCTPFLKVTAKRQFDSPALPLLLVSATIEHMVHISTHARILKLFANKSKHGVDHL